MAEVSGVAFCWIFFHVVKIVMPLLSILCVRKFPSQMLENEKYFQTY